MGQSAEPPLGQEPDPQIRNTTGGDWVIPVLAACFATYYLWSIVDIAWEAKVAAVFVATILYVLIAVLLVKTALGVVRGKLQVDFSSLWETPALFRIRGLLFVLAVASVAALPWLGFTLSTFAFLLASFLWLERMSAKASLITSGALALAAYILFIAVLRTAFPPGPFELAVHAITGI